MINGWV